MRKLFVLLLALLLLLLGVQRTPEAQVGEVIGSVAVAVVTGMVVGGCVHAMATARPDTDPMMLSPTEPPATTP